MLKAEICVTKYDGWLLEKVNPCHSTYPIISDTDIESVVRDELIADTSRLPTYSM